MSRGLDHAGDRLGVVSAHVRERQAEPVELGVEGIEVCAAQDPHKLRVPRLRSQLAAVGNADAAEAIGGHEVAVGQRDVRPRVPGADRANRRSLGLGAPDEVDQLL